MEPLTLRVSDRVRETHDTVTFRLEPVGAPLPGYRPGQFLTLLVDHYGREVRRSFSLTSSPADPFLSITVKRKVNGEISRYLQDRVPLGALLRSLPPSGRFTFEAAGDAGRGPAEGADRAVIEAARAPRDIGFIAAGSGIAPILPLLRQVLSEEPTAHVWLLYQNHSEADVIFEKALKELQAENAGRFTLEVLFSAPVAHTILPRRLNNANLEQFVRELTRFDPGRSLLYCCGPEALMRMARFTLRLMGFREDQFRQEHFTVDVVPHAPLIHDTSPKHVVLRTREKTYAFDVAYPANILQAALDHHIPLPYSCRGGRCSTCAVRCGSGRVVMSINDVLTEKDLKEGWVLTCTGYAATDLELEL